MLDQARRRHLSYSESQYKIKFNFFAEATLYRLLLKSAVQCRSCSSDNNNNTEGWRWSSLEEEEERRWRRAVAGSGPADDGISAQRSRIRTEWTRERERERAGEWARPRMDERLSFMPRGREERGREGEGAGARLA